MADQDLDAVAAKYGGTATDTEPGPDLDVLAKKYGSTSKSYDSALKPEQEAGYQKWLQEQKQKQGRDVSADTEDYDLKGYFLAGASNDDRGHGPDTFKKPNHPTFSTESQYSGKDNNVGGEWKEGPDGKTVFYASPTNLQYHSAKELQDYFKRVEPDAKLVLPTPPSQEPDLDAIAKKYGATGLDTLPPGPPSRPGVPGLTPPAQQPPRLNPRTGQPMYEAPPNPLDAAIAGPGQIIQGVERMATGLNPYSPQQVGRLKPTPLPGYDPEALPQGASQVIKGAMATASPLLPAAIVAAPVDALITMGGAAVADELGKRALTAAGATPAWATLGGNVIALGVVGGGARAIFGKADAMLDAHNQTADILVEQERRGGTSAQRLDEVFGGENHPIILDGGRKATLEYVGTGATETGRPLSQWRVVDADGKTLHSGTSRMTQEWLTAQRAQADVTDAPRVGQNEKLDKVPERKRGAELEKTLAEMRADINTPTEPPTPHLYDYLTPEQHSIAKIIEEGAERYRDIDNMAKHLESGEDVQMHERTMESTTPAQRREMLQQTVEEHKAIYEQFWDAVGKELGSKDTPAIREAMEKEVRQKYTRHVEEPEPVRPEAPAPADQEYKTWRDANFTRNKQGMWEDKTGNMFTGEALELEYGKRTVEPAKEHDFSSTQVNLAKPEADAVRSFASRIPDEQLAEKGRETEPHITVKYGLHGNEPKAVADLLRDTAPIKATIGKLDVFKSKDADVLIAKIDSPDLHAVNGKIADALPHTDTFPDYTPHMTLAYLKPGEGDKYLGQEIPGLTGQQVTLNALTFAGKDGKATDIPLPGRPQFSFPFHAFGEGGPVRVLGRAGDSDTDFRVQRPNGDTETMPGSSLMVNGQPVLHPAVQPPSTTEAIKPSVPTPIETAPVTPAQPQVAQPPSTTVYRSGVNQLNAHGMTWFSTDKDYSNRNFGEAQPYQIAPDARILDLPFQHDQPVTMPMLKAELEKQNVSLTTAEEQGLALALPSGGGGAQPFMFVRKELADAAKRAGFDAIRVNEMYANDAKNAAPSIAVLNPNIIGQPAAAGLQPAAPAPETKVPPAPGAISEPARQQIEQAVNDGIVPPEGDSKTVPAEPSGMPRSATITPTEVPNAGQPESGSDAQAAAGGLGSSGRPDIEALGTSLPDQVQQVKEDGGSPSESEGSSRTSRTGPGAVRGEGPELRPDAGTGSGDIRDATRRIEGQRPPRAQDVDTTRHERDYRIPDGRVISGSPEARAEANLAAIRILRTIEAENRPATVDEQHILARYVGWGAVPQLFAGQTDFWKGKQNDLRAILSEEEFDHAQRSTTNAHFTSDAIVDAMWAGMDHLGAKEGMSWLEPAVGVGNFFGRQPEALLKGSRRMGLDKDTVSGKIAKLLYPDSGIEIQALEKAELPPDYFDGIISNVPFGDFGVHDPAFKQRFLTGSIHNYFFAKAATLVRPGGVVAFVTSRYTLDAYAPGHVRFREWMAERMDMIGAVRLPSGAFRQNAGTDVITDVIFLRRRLPGEASNGVAWTESRGKQMKSQYGSVIELPVNEYFHAHPEMILGTEGTSRGMYSANDYDVKGQLTPENLDAAIKKLPANQFTHFERAKSKRVAIRELGVTTGEFKTGGLFFDKDGNLFRKLGTGTAEPVTVSETTKARVRGQLLIRDILTKLHDLELNDGPKAAMDAARKQLNEAYDLFIKKWGPLSSSINQQALDGDQDGPLVLSLERGYDRKANTADKTPIFERRVLEKARAVTSAGDPKEALYVSLNAKGTLDWDFMAGLTNGTPESLQNELSSAGLVYKDPLSKTWYTAEDYLSGSVRKKLEVARSIAKLEPEFDRNVAALEKVQPIPIPPGEIRVILGATWVPNEVYSHFATSALGGPVEVTYGAGEWFVSSKGRLPTGGKFDTARVTGGEILKNTLNQRQTKVYDHTREGDILNRTETIAAASRQREMNDAFQNWLLVENPTRADEMAKLYNDLNNDLREQHFDGSHLTLPGMSRAALRGGDLEPHQKSAVWRGISQPNVLLAHAVGTGKTFEMIAIGMELKRLGLIKRPMYNVPNETLGSWQDQFRALYPQARVLVLDEKHLDKKSRRETLAKIQTQEWDAVVVPHSAFQKITTSQALFDEQYEQLEEELTEQILAATDAGLDSRFIKRMEKAKERTLERMLKRRNAEAQDLTVTWEGLGIDQLFVDESHKYKKLGFFTKQANVAGIDQNGNQRTFDLAMKVRYTQKAGRGVVFATGTPITNTMGELFSIMRYLIEPELQARGMAKFDDWSANFGRTVQVFEPKLEGGGHQTKSRFAKFVNLPEMTQLFRTFADVVTADMVKLPIPTLKGGGRQAVLTNLTPTQREVVQYLRRRAASIRQDPRKALPDNLLAVYTDAQKMALDVRMLLPDAEHDENGRLAQAADLVYKIWQESEKVKGVQLIFADFGKPADAGGSSVFSPYDALIKLLQDKGIPASDIAHIYQAKNKTQREKLFEKVRRGDIRVILGSTDKMGVGVNIQDRAIALHHLDIPHRPDQLEQREGRILRQGNRNEEVGVYYYLTKESLDESKFANVVRKGKFVNDALRGSTTVREAEDVEGMVMSLEQFQAMVSGDPRVMRKIQVDAEVERLGSLQSAWRNQQYERNRRIQDDQHAIFNHEKRVEGMESDIGKKTDEPNFVVGKQKITGEGAFSKASDALHLFAMETVRTHKGEDRVPIGSAYGLPITVDKRFGGTLYLGSTDWWHLVDIKPAGLMHAIQNAAKSVDKSITKAKGQIAALKLEISSIEDELRKGWPYQEQLRKAVDEQEQLFKALGGDKNDDTAMAMNDGEEIPDANVEGETEGDEEAADVDAGEAEDIPQSDVMMRLELAKERAKAAAPPDPKKGVPISNYKAGAGKLATPDAGWMTAKIGERDFFSNGHALFEGEAPGEKQRTSPPFQAVWDKTFGKEMAPLRPVGYSKLEEKAATGAERLVWFDNGTAVDARYYDYAKKRWKDAEFKQADKEGEAVAVSAEGRDVGIIMPLRSAPPDGIKALIQKFWTEETGTSTVGAAVSDIVHQTVLPGIRAATTTYNGVRDDLMKLFAPHNRSYAAKNAGGLARETGGELAQRRDRARAALEDFRAYFDGQTVLRRFEIIDSIETGELDGLTDYERNFVQVMRDLLEPRQRELEDLGLLKHFIENYFPHYWKNPDEAAKFVDNWMSKRPFAGGEAYRKRRKIPTIREGMDDPEFHLVPAFDNPVDFVLAKLGEVDKSIVAHKAFNELRDSNRITYIPSWRKLPAGMDYIDDRLFVVRGPRKGAVGLPDEAVHAVLPGEEMEEGGVRPEDVTVYGKREMGRWAAVEPVSRVLNNHLSPSPYRGSLQNVFKAWSGINRTLNMIELGFSWFHGMTTSLNSSISDVALSMAEMQAGKPMAAAKAFTRGIVPFASIVYDMFYGTEIQRVWDGKPGDEMTEALVDALKAAGGRARQDQYWTTSHAEAFMKTLRRGGPSLLGLPFRLPFAVLEATIKPIMAYVVPRAKLSAFAKRAQMEIERRPDMTRDEARKVFGDIWDSVDNRFGQLVQDNMLMNRTARGALNSIVGRPGWNIGTVRELGGGALDLAKAIMYVGGGPRPNITDRSRYLIAMLIVAFLWNGLLNYALTGDMPRGMDFLMPRDGGYQEDGHPSRVVLPFYVAKDVYSYATNFRQTLLNKLMPTLTMAGDLFQNRDFYHRKIYGDGGIGVLPFLSNFLLPYSVQGVVQNYGRGEKPGKMAMPLVGVMPASRRASLSDAEKFMSDYWADQRPGTLREKTERQRVTAQVTQQLRSGNKDAAFSMARAAVSGGVIQWKDIERAVESAHTSPLMSEFKHLPLEVAIEAEKHMTPEERQKTAKLFADKVIRDLPTKAPNERRELWEEIQSSGILRR